METYCVSCNKNTANENSSVRKTKQNRLMLLSKCAVYGKKKIEVHCKSRTPLRALINCFVLINFEMINLK